MICPFPFSSLSYWFPNCITSFANSCSPFSPSTITFCLASWLIHQALHLVETDGEGCPFCRHHCALFVLRILFLEGPWSVPFMGAALQGPQAGELLHLMMCVIVTPRREALSCSEPCKVRGETDSLSQLLIFLPTAAWCGLHQSLLCGIHSSQSCLGVWDKSMHRLCTVPSFSMACWHGCTLWGAKSRPPKWLAALSDSRQGPLLNASFLCMGPVRPGQPIKGGAVL